MPNKYRLRSFDIEAMQWDGTQQGATPIIDWVLSKDGTARWNEGRTTDTSTRPNGETVSFQRQNPVRPHIAVDTRDPVGTTKAFQNDWVIRMSQGEQFDWVICSPENFEETFEPVPA